MSIRLACLLASMLALAGCHAPGRPLESEELQRAFRDVASLAGEAMLMTEQMRTGHVSPVYVRVHQEAMLEDSNQVAKALGKPAPDALRSGQQEAASLQSRLTSLVEQLEGDATAAQLDPLHRQLEQLQARAKSLAGTP